MAKQQFSAEQQSVRVLKVGERVRHILSELLARGEAHDDVLSASNIAVTEVRMTPDLRNAAKNQLYDSTVDNVRDPSIFVTYHDAQAYPESARGVLASRRRRRGGGESIASRRAYR